jgi:hypothetical protein
MTIPSKIMNIMRWIRFIMDGKRCRAGRARHIGKPLKLKQRK